MQFAIDADHGNSIFFWLVPDNPDMEIRVFVGNPEIGYREIAANQHRQDLVDLGFHESGWAGFRIDESNFPEIAQLSELQIIDADSLVPIYARNRGGRFPSSRLLIWDFWGYPHARDIAPVMARHALSYETVDALPSETVNAVLSSTLSTSVAAAGRLPWRRVRPMVESLNYTCYALIGDPCAYLARRLVDLQRPLRDAAQGMSRSENLRKLAQDLDLGSDRGISAFLKGLMDEDRLALRSPMTRAFARGAGEDCRRQDIVYALQTLSHFDLVCTDKTKHLFSAYFAAPKASVPTAEQISEAQPEQELIDRLRRLGPVDDYLNEDIALYEFISEAIAKAQAKSEGQRNAQSA
ncbi:hypothetical protein C8J27_105255 [Rhodobacter aestuarii]|uniref:Uncharacterized protein n=1 Tax=Rhodobacter aestuarii TaxID=453582 RepID=A0A1N7LDL8_9RHOB|nr:hypothetical protein [Rhodobacter aestuarii]PTV95308.1 hypothetical protein C8J27_105255 [Rhodobacter aestuarii]SIS71914.1 hypothetical protein SAMN05421580_10421 [Rhodobacter aestuarii]